MASDTDVRFIVFGKRRPLWSLDWNLLQAGNKILGCKGDTNKMPEPLLSADRARIREGDGHHNFTLLCSLLECLFNTSKERFSITWH